MMDISDGLSSEVLHICKQSNCGAVLYEEKIPVHDDARQFAYKLDMDPTACALSGGEAAAQSGHLARQSGGQRRG